MDWCQVKHQQDRLSGFSPMCSSIKYYTVHDLDQFPDERHTVANSKLESIPKIYLNSWKLVASI